MCSTIQLHPRITFEPGGIRQLEGEIEKKPIELACFSADGRRLLTVQRVGAIHSE